MTLIVSTENELLRVTPPNLPLAPLQYNQDYHEQYSNVLRLYFNQLNKIVGQLKTGSGSIDGSGIRLPYGAFSSNQDQTTTANTATLMTLNTTDFANGVSIASSKITATTAGIYNLQFSTQFVNNDTQLQDVSIWLKQNGTDIPGSTGFISVPNRHGGIDGHSIVGWNYFLSMTAGQYVELYWSTTNVAVTIQHYPTTTGPVRPSTQSVVATLSFVSALP